MGEEPGTRIDYEEDPVGFKLVIEGEMEIALQVDHKKGLEVPKCVQLRSAWDPPKGGFLSASEIADRLSVGGETRALEG